MNIYYPYGTFDGVGSFGMEHYKYLKWLHRDSLNALIHEGILNEYLRDVDRKAHKRIRDYMKKAPYPDENAPDFEGQYHRFLAVTNNGDAAAKSTEALVICFDADGNYFCSMKILGIYDDEYELKPGATESGSGRKDGSFSDFETAEVYLRSHSY